MTQPASKRLVTEATGPTLFAAKWRANTAYVAGNPVINPNGDAVVCLTSHTSTSTYDDSKWALPARVAAAIAAAASADHGDMFLGLAMALKYGLDSVAVQATGDSTLVSDQGWFRLLANDLAAAYPAYTHNYLKWNDTTQDMDRPIVLSTGAAGRRAMKMAAGGTRAGAQFSGDNIAGDLDVRVDMNSPSWAAGATQIVTSKWYDDNSASWVLMLTSTGNLRFQSGTTGLISGWAVDKTSSAAVPFTNNNEGWIRVVLDVDNGASGNDVKFYTSTDGVTWTQLGTTQTTAGVTSLFASTSPYTLGVRGGIAAACVSDTRFYEIQIRDGINGPNIVPALPDLWQRTLDVATGVPIIEGAPVCTWLMSGQSGAGIGYDAQTVGYLADPVRMKKMSPNYGQMAMLFACSHNDYNLEGNLWATKYEAWVEGVSYGKNVASRIITTENPRTGASISNGHKIRRGDLMAFTRRKPSYALIDTYQAFLDDGRDLATVLIVDGVHPASPGYLLEKNKVRAEFTAAEARVTAAA